MKIYLFQRKKKPKALLRWAYLIFIGLWAISFAFEFLLSDSSLFTWFMPISLLPLSFIIGLPVLGFFRRPYIEINSATDLKLTLNTKVPLGEIYNSGQLALTANYLYSHELGISGVEITRRSALKIARAFPAIEIELAAQRSTFDHTTMGRWLASGAKVLLWAFFAGVLFFGFVLYPTFTNKIMIWDRPVAVEAAMEWGGLARPPVSLSNMDISTEGSMFTRTFIIEFESDSARIGHWIDESFGIREVAPLREGDLYIYKSPGFEGAFGGTVTIDYSDGSVVIKMSWS